MFVNELEVELGDVMLFYKLKGGMFLWVNMKNGSNIMCWLEKMLSNGVVFVLGEFFYCNELDYLMLCMLFVMLMDEELKEVVCCLKKLL